MTIQLQLNSDTGLPDLDGLLTGDSKKRYQWLLDCTPVADRCYFPGGTIAYSLFKASRYCYVYGHYLATVVLGLSYIEKTLYGMLGDRGREGVSDRGLATLNKKALISGLINEEIYEIIDRTRILRNRFPPFNTNGDRSVNGRRNLYRGSEVYEDDARKLLGITLRLLNQKH